MLAGLFPAIRSGFDKSLPLSKTSRLIRIVGGSIWAGLILIGMLAQLWYAIH
jgi:hypothetical protein